MHFLKFSIFCTDFRFIEQMFFLFFFLIMILLVLFRVPPSHDTSAELRLPHPLPDTHFTHQAPPFQSVNDFQPFLLCYIGVQLSLDCWNMAPKPSWRASKTQGSEQESFCARKAPLLLLPSFCYIPSFIRQLHTGQRWPELIELGEGWRAAAPQGHGGLSI